MIREARPADAETIHALRVANRAYLEPWEPDDEAPDRRYEIEYARDWVARAHRFVIVDDGGSTVGCISLYGEDFEFLRSAGVGYWLAQAAAGRGLASAAVHELAGIAFRELGLHRLEAGTRIENVASQRVLEKARFTRVGVLRQHLLIGGVWRDHFLYERLADD